MHFHPKTWRNLEEHLWIELWISIDKIILFYSFEVIVLLFDRKVMTFVFNPLFRFRQIVKYWNTTESFSFEGVIVWSMLNQLKLKFC